MGLQAWWHLLMRSSTCAFNGQRCKCRSLYQTILLHILLPRQLMRELLICLEFPSEVHVEILSALCFSFHQSFVQHRFLLQCSCTCSMFGIFAVWDVLLLSWLPNTWIFLRSPHAMVPCPLHALVYLIPSTFLPYVHPPASFALFQSCKQLLLSSIVRSDTWDPILRRPSSLPVACLYLSLRARWSFACAFHRWMEKRITIQHVRVLFVHRLEPG
mmetsp:Transcript_9357/g.57028  ORF Transcript_9357/g.57028 Transcript_9357/m.57028 type:complete len:215 (-) Transcript_9357:2195-2839(-)